MRSFEKNIFELSFSENMFSDFVFSSIDERDCFDVFIDEMICIDDKFILDELLSNLVRKIESVFAELEEIRHFDIFVFFIDKYFEIRS